MSIIIIALPLGVVLAQEGDSTYTPTNLELIQRLSEQVGDTVATLMNEGDSVRVTVFPGGSAWYVESSILQAVSGKGRKPTASVSAPYDVELGLENAEVRYTDIRRSGLFGSKVVDRFVSVKYTAKVVNKQSGAILMTGNITRSSDDTVEASDIANLENPRIAATQGTLPTEGFFSSLVEPLVTMGAIAVAVYLLFQVRS